MWMDDHTSSGAPASKRVSLTPQHDDIAISLIIIIILYIEGCFSNTDCTGALITAGSARDCCVGTDDGFSYGTPGNCRECIGKHND